MAEGYPKIFINYRRKDARGLVEKLYEHLASLYGKEEVFFDQSSIKKGAGITESIQQSLSHCDLFLPVIGPNWDAGKYLKRLNDPSDWVRQEMELAISLKKQILPILIDRERVPGSNKIPDSINYQAIFDINGIILKDDTQYWDEEIKRYAAIIKTYTGLQPKKTNDHASKDEQCIEQICYLNREKAYGKIKYPQNKGQFMFAATGSKSSGFKAFARRCSLDLLDGAAIKTINWKQFEEMPNPRARKSELLDQIAKELGRGDDVKGLNEEDKIKQLQIHFSNKKYFFRCTRNRSASNNHNRGVMQEWWEAWASLVDNDDNQNLLVLLFSVPGWMYRLNLCGYFRKNAKPDNLGTLGGVHKDDVFGWKEQHLGDTDCTVSDKQISRLFFLNLRKDFQAVENMLLHSMKKVRTNNTAN